MVPNTDLRNLIKFDNQAEATLSKFPKKVVISMEPERDECTSCVDELQLHRSDITCTKTEFGTANMLPAVGQK
jgi:hypothetical protein